MTSQLQRAYVGMQCFWGVESSFARLAGVLKTRVGYAGGTTPSPTYKDIGDHTEVAELQFDPSLTSYDDILSWFFANHDPTVAHKKQYASVILWVDEAQRAAAERAVQRAKEDRGRAVTTEVKKFDKFHQAEHYHQKYWLRTTIFDQLKLSDAEVADSTLAAKLNAFLGGFTDFAVLRQLQKDHGLSDALVSEVERIAKAGGVGGCH